MICAADMRAQGQSVETGGAVQPETISFAVSRHDRAAILKITTRAIRLARAYGLKLEKINTMMDLVARHANGNPLRLENLAEADDFNLMHDVLGIREHLDRETGKLTGFFSPRFSDHHAQVPA